MTDDRSPATLLNVEDAAHRDELSEKPLRVLLAEDHVLLRAGLIHMLEAHGCTIAAAVEDGPSLQRALAENDFDIAVVDVRLPPTFTDEGLRAAIEARAGEPQLPVLVLSQYVEHLYARELLSQGTGAVGYLLKDRVSDVEGFLDALHQVASGGTAMDPRVISQLLMQKREATPVASLTKREHEVLEQVAAGKSNAAIAEALFITEKAVSKYTGVIFDKLGLPPDDDSNRRVLAVLAYLDSNRDGG